MESIRREYLGYKLMRFRVPSLNVPPLIAHEERGDHAAILFQYVTGGLIKTPVGRLDRVLPTLPVAKGCELITEVFDVVLKKCHWLDGYVETKLLDAPEIPTPQVGSEGALWERAKSAYSQLVGNARGASAPYGITHGDLHAKNILVVSEAWPVIIDFSHALADSCIYADYAKLEVHLQFYCPVEYLQEFDRVKHRLYSRDRLILPRSGVGLAAWVHHLRSILWKNCLSRTVGLSDDDIDRGYRLYIGYFLLRACSKAYVSSTTKETAVKELELLAGL